MVEKGQKRERIKTDGERCWEAGGGGQAGRQSSRAGQPKGRGAGSHSCTIYDISGGYIMPSVATRRDPEKSSGRTRGARPLVSVWVCLRCMCVCVCVCSWRFHISNYEQNEMIAELYPEADRSFVWFLLPVQSRAKSCFLRGGL